MKLKHRFALLILTMVLFVVAVIGITVYRDYQNRLRDAEKNVQKIAETQAVFIGMLYRETGNTRLILDVVKQSLCKYKDMDFISEFDLVAPKADSAHFLICYKKNRLLSTHLALKHHSSEIVNIASQQIAKLKEENGREVLFICHAVEGLNWKVVVIQDIEWIKAPFVKNMFLVSVLSVVVICIGVFAFFIIAYPAVKQQEENEERFIQLVNNIKEVFFLRTKTEYLYVSPSIKRMSGYDPEILYKDPKAWFKWLHPDDRHRMEHLDWEAEAGKYSQQECRLICADGAVRWLQIKAYPVSVQLRSRPCSVSVVSDITEQRELISALKLNEARYRTIFSTCPDAIAISNPDGTLVDVNEVFLRITGYTYEEVVGARSVDLGLWMSEDERKRAIEYLETMGHFENVEFDFKTNGGGVVTCLVSATMLDIGEGRHILSIVRDITDRKRIVNELKAAKEKAEESDKLKTAFLNNISHEFRTPINSIVGFSELLTTPNQTKEKQALYSNQIINGCNKLIEIVNLTVEMSQIQSQQVRYYESYFNLTSLINRIDEDYREAALAKKLDFSIQTNFMSANSSIYSDFNKLFKIMKYLVDNAIKFTKYGSVSVDCMLENGHLLFSVQDTGIGISSEMQSKVFDIFRQIETGLSRNYGGNGLGLSIAKAYVEVLGGRIGLESELGRGTIVYFTVPAMMSHQQEHVQPDEASEYDWAGKTVLVAEDNISNYDLLEELLEPTGIKILHAKNGLEAVVLVSKNEVDLVLMDVKMPVMDGFSATKEIHKINARLPILAITSFTNESYSGQLLIDEFRELISKPISGTALLKTMKKYIEE